MVESFEDLTEKFLPEGFAKQKAVMSIPELFGRSMKRGIDCCWPTVSLGYRLFSIAAFRPGVGGVSFSSAICSRIISSSLSYGNVSGCLSVSDETWLASGENGVVSWFSILVMESVAKDGGLVNRCRQCRKNSSNKMRQKSSLDVVPVTLTALAPSYSIWDQYQSKRIKDL